MDRTTRQLAGDIKAGRNLEQVLPELMNRMASAYGMLSYYNMNMELSVYTEAKEEGIIKPGRTVKELEENSFEKEQIILSPYKNYPYKMLVNA